MGWFETSTFCPRIWKQMKPNSQKKFLAENISSTPISSAALTRGLSIVTQHHLECVSTKLAYDLYVFARWYRDLDQDSLREQIKVTALEARVREEPGKKSKWELLRPRRAAVSLADTIARTMAMLDYSDDEEEERSPVRTPVAVWEAEKEKEIEFPDLEVWFVMLFIACVGMEKRALFPYQLSTCLVLLRYMKEPG